ncbi:phospholipid scramblase family member 5 [Ptiloglossa arizonensis]|uniref:phospholipid scramblase family member 5 n=1 Tax=Ptiloglossa arizonensis TaxID=3350558 RepID=UPI003F9ED745
MRRLTSVLSFYIKPCPRKIVREKSRKLPLPDASVILLSSRQHYPRPRRSQAFNERNMTSSYSGTQLSPYSPSSPMQLIATPPAPGAFLVPQPDMPMIPQGGWLPPNTTCPPGLESLILLDYLFVRQSVESIDAFIVVNNRGEHIFYIEEQLGICGRLCLSSHGSCEFQVIDINRREVMRMIRPQRCDSCCCPCYLQELEVYSGNILLGSVLQNWSLLQPSFSIRNAPGETVLIIKGPRFWCCEGKIFKVKSTDGQYRVGVIKNEWAGFIREVFTSADDFGISFPIDLDVKIKAVLLGACLLIDYMYFNK